MTRQHVIVEEETREQPRGRRRSRSAGSARPPPRARSRAGSRRGLVRVPAISLNRGEVRRSAHGGRGRRPGWDLAGVVERAAADGRARAAAARGRLLSEGRLGRAGGRADARARRAARRGDVRPAATFPVAGLTALYALAKRGLLLGRRVLVTGATGGVGDFAVQLARLSGAHVTAARGAPTRRRRCASSAPTRSWWATTSRPRRSTTSSSSRWADGRSAPRCRARARRRVRHARRLRVRRGHLRHAQFFVTGRTTLYGFYLFTELGSEPASMGLRRLAELVASGQLAPHVSLERPWKEIGQVAPT